MKNGWQFENVDQVTCSFVKFCHCTVILYMYLENILVINRIWFAVQLTLLMILTPHRPVSLSDHVEPRGNKSFVFAQQVSARCEFSARLAMRKQTFYSPETQHGRRVIKVYCWLQNVVLVGRLNFCCSLRYFPEQRLVIKPS